jgi:hypothetical protein
MVTQPPNGQQYGPGITRISVTGFKSLAEKTEVEIRPLTVLAGANSSGKSSLMQPLLLMKQTLESDFNAAGPFLLSGPYAQYSEAKQFLSRAQGLNDSIQSLTLEFGFDEGMAAGMTYLTGSEAGLSVGETWGSNAAKQLKWRIAKSSTPEELKAMLLKFGSIPLLMEQVGLTVLAVQDYGFYQCVLYATPAGSGMQQRELYFWQENLALNSQIRRMIYVPGVRGGRGRKELFAEITEHGFFPGSFESYAPSLIYSWQQSRERKKIHELVRALGTLELAAGIGAVRQNESELEIRVPRTRNSDHNDFVNIADVGLAVPTVFPVLVALIQAEPGQLIYIEQPELHLHPRAQWRLAQLIADAANRGVRLVIETHSSLLLQGILTCVAKGVISPQKVALHWFARNDVGFTTVKTANLDSEGRVGDWPSDFDDVELRASNDYLDAVEARLMAGKGAA